jgi:Flp pilus assembly protein CpaB
MIFIVRRVAIASAFAMAAVLLWVRRVDRGTPGGKIATIPVVVAAKDMPEGVIVDRMALVVAQWPAGTQPAGAYTSVDSVAGRVTRVPVYKGEAMVPGRLAPEGTGAGLEVKITPLQPDTLTVKVFRGRARIDPSFAQDSAKRRPRP